jgi:endonuclease G
MIKIPTLFWKVVFFEKSDGKLYRAAFLMSQESLLRDNSIVESFRDSLEALDDEDKLFAEFAEAETYQVNISTIEKLSRMTFPKAKDIYEDDRSIKLILKEVDVLERFDDAPDAYNPGFEIEGLRL